MEDIDLWFNLDHQQLLNACNMSEDSFIKGNLTDLDLVEYLTTL